MSVYNTVHISASCTHTQPSKPTHLHTHTDTHVCTHFPVLMAMLRDVSSAMKAWCLGKLCNCQSESATSDTPTLGTVSFIGRVSALEGPDQEWRSSVDLCVLSIMCANTVHTHCLDIHAYMCAQPHQLATKQPSPTPRFESAHAPHPQPVGGTQ